jgi:preprotein translocase subunit YajC
MPRLALAAAPILAQTEGGGSNAIGFLLPLVILGGLFYFMLVMPQRRRAKKAKELRQSITVGDEIRTIGGIFGTVRSEDDDSFIIDIGGGSTMRIAKQAVAERTGDDTE